MAETPETKVKTKFKKFMKFMEKAGAVWWTALSSRYHSGIPDFFVLIEGEPNFVEAKEEGKTPTPLQTHIAKRIIKAGGKYWVVTINKEDKLCLTEYLGQGRTLRSAR